MKLVRCALYLSLAGFLSVSCSSNEKKTDTAEGAYAVAEDFEKAERFEEALKRYQEVRNKFPYNRYATQAELAMADVYFKQESFPEAQVAYQAFRDLHPKHPQIDYVIFQIGMSYFKQLPSTIDRDLSLAPQAIQYFEDLLRLFPASEKAKEAKEKITESRLMLAQKETYIADFYFRKEKYDSALNRYEELARNFSGLETEPKALARAALSAQFLGELEKARALMAELNKKYPDHPETREASGRIR
jgi:outer membrane protein assembly factor BamD